LLQNAEDLCVTEKLLSPAGTFASHLNRYLCNISGILAWFGKRIFSQRV